MTETPKRVDVILANGSILARILSALVNIDLALLACETGHTNTLVAALLIQASALVHAGIVVTLVDVDLATSAREPLGALAPEGSGSVDTQATVFAWGTGSAFVSVNGTI